MENDDRIKELRDGLLDVLCLHRDFLETHFHVVRKLGGPCDVPHLMYARSPTVQKALKLAYPKEHRDDQPYPPFEEQSIVEKLRIRAEIRRNATSRKSVQENQPDRLSELLEEAANRIADLENRNAMLQGKIDDRA